MKHFHLRLLSIGVIMLSPFCYLNAKTFLECIPEVKIQSTKTQQAKSKLNHVDAEKNRLIIGIINGQYYWETRKNTILAKSSSGIYDNYISSSGYVKVENAGENKAYIEHVHLGLATMTYWGHCK